MKEWGILNAPTQLLALTKSKKLALKVSFCLKKLFT